MSAERTLGGQTGELFNRVAWLDDFQSALESSSPVPISEWVSEIPAEHRDDVVPILLSRYIGHFRQMGWTVNLTTLLESLPEFAPFISQLLATAPQNVGPCDTVRTNSLRATTTYEVDGRKWKEGGQGVLHKAVENGIGGRQVVVKYLKDPDHRREFEKEIEVTSRLEHPGVAAVFSYGMEDSLASRPFYAMRLIHGNSLEDCIADFHNRMAQEKSPRHRYFNRSDESGIAPILESLISACHTVAHAHSVGVLHCDLKPKNIVCGDFRATIVLDWGSARSFKIEGEGPSDSTPRIVLTEETGGSYTVGYASPEQLEQRELSCASDVFCLGATLYHVLTGQPPFRSDRQSTTACIPPSQIVAGVPKRLERICIKAMQPSAEDRYQNAASLARDLTCWLRDEAVTASPDSATERVFRVARHHKQATAIGCAALFAVMVLGFTAWNLSIQRRMVSASLGSAFSLIEDLCKPLEDDAISNSTEFQSRANQVASFAREYIRERPKDAKLGEAYELSALVHFYQHNRALNVTQTNNSNPLDELDLAIKDLRSAEEIYRAESNFVSQAENLVRQGRWIRKLGDFGREKSENQAASFRKLVEAIKLVPAPKTINEISVVAEANQILGELALSNKTAFVFQDQATLLDYQEGQSFAQIQRNLQMSVAYFSNAIMSLSDKPAQHRRNLARGYGYRGDSYMAIQQYELAYQDYIASLGIRETAYQAEASDENGFQLSRGFGNLGALVLNTPSSVPLAELDSLSDDRPREIVVLDKYVSRSLSLMKELAIASDGDARPQNDYRRICNVAAMLCYFASQRDGLSLEQQDRYLQDAERFADSAIEEFPVTPDAGQGVRDNLAESYATKIQIAIARERISGEARVDGDAANLKQKYATNVARLLRVSTEGARSLGSESLICCAIAYATSNHGELPDLLRLMRTQGLNDDPFCRKQLKCFSGEPGVGELIDSLFQE